MSIAGDQLRFGKKGSILPGNDSESLGRGGVLKHDHDMTRIPTLRISSESGGGSDSDNLNLNFGKPPGSEPTRSPSLVNPDEPAGSAVWPYQY